MAISLERVMYFLMAAILALLAWQDYAGAQEQPTPRERAYMERINIEISNNLVCSTNAQALLDKVKDLQAKLDAKSPEPKKD